MFPWLSTTPLRLGGGPGGELDKRDVREAGVKHGALVAKLMNAVHQQQSAAQPVDLATTAHLLRVEHSQAVEQRFFSVQPRVAEKVRDAQQLAPVFVADADGHRHRHDAAIEACPEGVDELLVVLAVQHHVVAGLHALRLQEVQDAERPIVQLAVPDDALIMLAKDVCKTAIALRAFVEHGSEARELVYQL